MRVPRDVLGERMHSPQQAVLASIAERINAGQSVGLEQLFSETFVLHDPTTPDWPSGRDGVRRMLAEFAALGPTLQLDAVDMIEQDDRVAVRWRVRWTGKDDDAQEAAIVAIYRFENGLIAEDWGVSVRAAWP